MTEKDMEIINLNTNLRLSGLLRVSNTENNRLKLDLSNLVCAILKRNGKDVLDMSANDRLAELHENEKRLASVYKLVKNANLL